MNALRRVLLTFLSVVIIAVPILMVVMLVNSKVAFAVVNFLDKYFLYNMEQIFLNETGIWWIVLIGLLLLAFGLFCLVVALMPKPADKKLRVATVDGGTVDIGLTALQSVVQKAAATHPGITKTEAKLFIKNNGLHVYVNLAVREKQSMPEVGNAVSEQVKTQLEAMAGIIPAEVKVIVTEVIDQPEEGIIHGN